MTNGIETYYSEFDLPSWAIEVVRNQLSGLGLSLAQLLSEQSLCIKVKTFAPLFAQEKILASYAYSIYGWISKENLDLLYQKRIEANVKTPELDLWLIPLIIQYLSQDSNNICLLSDPYLDQNDLLEQNYVYCMYNNEVYIVASSDSSDEMIKKAMSLLLHDSLFCVFTVAHKSFELKLDLQSLNYWAENTKKIVVSAYDGESYLLWE